MLPFALAFAAVLSIWAMYKVIIYALPCLLGLGTASMAINTGAGWLGASLAGAVVAASSFYLLRFLITKVRSRTVRLAIATLLAAPSGLLAYNIAIDALTSGVPTELWRETLSIAFALFASAAAFARLTELEAPDL